jgi:thermostable 8-oxoguanine DNA glycosylase
MHNIILFMHLLHETSIQRVFARTETGVVSHEVPSAGETIGNGSLQWGMAEELLTPAYWATQAWMWEVEAPEHYKLGNSLEEETLACLLGGYGIPAEVGLAAYERLRERLCEDPAALKSEDAVLEMLLTPLNVAGRSVRYRFAKQKARYISAAMNAMPQVDRDASDRDLRGKLIDIPGIGLKTASWIVRNWRNSDEVSILDIHILRAGQILGVFPKEQTVEKHYLNLENLYLEFAASISVRASILDSVMWMTMRQMPNSMIKTLLGEEPDASVPSTPMQLALSL